MIKATLILIITISSYSVYAQLDTIRYDNGEFCLFDLKYRPPVGFEVFNFEKGSVLHSINSSSFIDHQICYDSKGFITFEKTYLNLEKSDYKTVYRDSTGFKFYEEITLLSDSSNIFIRETFGNKYGGLDKVITFEGNHRSKVEYYIDSLNNNIKSISRWKKIYVGNRELDFYQDSLGNYYAESISQYGYSYVPSGIYYEFHENGIVKSKGYFKKTRYAVFKSKTDYLEYLKEPKLMFLTEGIDNRLKIGTWYYYNNDGSLIKTIEY